MMRTASYSPSQLQILILTGYTTGHPFQSYTEQNVLVSHFYSTYCISKKISLSIVASPLPETLAMYKKYNCFCKR